MRTMHPIGKGQGTHIAVPLGVPVEPIPQNKKNYFHLLQTFGVIYMILSI